MAVTPITPGYTFSGTSPNNSVTAAKLNDLVGLAVVNPSLISDQTEKVSPASGDMFLIWDSATNTFKKASYGNFIPSARGKTGSTNLLIYTSTATTGTISATEILMKSSAGLPYVATSFSVTFNIAVSGANGLDAGTATANTWYYFWAISTGTTDRCLISASATAPTLPGGYIYSALLGAVRYDNASHFNRIVQHGNVVACEIGSVAGTADTARLINPKTGGVEFNNIAVAVANTFQAADLSQCIPPNIVASVRGIIGHTAIAAQIQFGLASLVSGGSLTSLPVTIGLTILSINASTAVSGGASTNGAVLAGFRAEAMFETPIKDSQQIMWTSTNDASSTQNMRITGYRLAL